MGFHKRFISRDTVLSKKNINDVLSMLNADALIYDNWSYNFFKEIKGLKKEDIQNFQKRRNELQMETMFKSSLPDVSSINDIPLSLTYINLLKDPCWIDIQLASLSFKEDIPFEIQGHFRGFCEFYINLIENKFNNEYN